MCCPYAQNKRLADAQAAAQDAVAAARAAAETADVQRVRPSHHPISHQHLTCFPASLHSLIRADRRFLLNRPARHVTPQDAAVSDLKQQLTAAHNAASAAQREHAKAMAEAANKAAALQGQLREMAAAAEAAEAQRAERVAALDAARLAAEHAASREQARPRFPSLLEPPHLPLRISSRLSQVTRFSSLISFPTMDASPRRCAAPRCRRSSTRRRLP